MGAAQTIGGLLGLPFAVAFIVAGFWRVTPWVIVAGAAVGTALYVMIKGGIPVVWRRDPVKMTATIMVAQAVTVGLLYAAGYVASLLFR